MTGPASQTSSPEKLSSLEKLPGGLVVLALASFIFAILAFMGLLKAHLDLADPAKVARYVELTGASESVLRLHFWLTAAMASLLILSGIGYFRRSLVMGRMGGTCFAIVALAKIALEVFGTNLGFTLAALAGLAWPGIVLAFVHGRYKSVLVRVP